MPVNRWPHAVHLTDLWQDPDHPPKERRAEITERLRASVWPRITHDPEKLEHLLRGFADPQETDAYYHRLWWEALNELADADRVWLETYEEAK